MRLSQSMRNYLSGDSGGEEPDIIFFARWVARLNCEVSCESRNESEIDISSEGYLSRSFIQSMFEVAPFVEIVCHHARLILFSHFHRQSARHHRAHGSVHRCANSLLTSSDYHFGFTNRSLD